MKNPTVNKGKRNHLSPGPSKENTVNYPLQNRRHNVTVSKFVISHVLTLPTPLNCV